MIDRLLAFPRLELASFWKRPLPVFMYAILTLLSFGLVAGGVQVAAGSADTGGAKLAINGGFNLAFVDVVIFAIVLPFFAAVACGMPLLVDGDRRIQKLLTATPLSWQEYAWSRFLARSPSSARCSPPGLSARSRSINPGRSTRRSGCGRRSHCGATWRADLVCACRWWSSPAGCRCGPGSARGSRCSCLRCRL